MVADFPVNTLVPNIEYRKMMPIRGRLIRRETEGDIGCR